MYDNKTGLLFNARNRPAMLPLLTLHIIQVPMQNLPNTLLLRRHRTPNGRGRGLCWSGRELLPCREGDESRERDSGSPIAGPTTEGRFTLHPQKNGTLGKTLPYEGKEAGITAQGHTDHTAPVGSRTCRWWILLSELAQTI